MSTWALGNWQAFVTIFWIFGDFLFRIIGWNKQTNKKNNNETKVGLLSASQPYYIFKNIFSSFWQATRQRFSCPPYQIAYLCPVKLPLCLLISGTYLNGWAGFFFFGKENPQDFGIVRETWLSLIRDSLVKYCLSCSHFTQNKMNAMSKLQRCY